MLSTQPETRDRTNSKTGEAPTFTKPIVQQTAANQGHSTVKVTPTAFHTEAISPTQLFLLE